MGTLESGSTFRDDFVADVLDEAYWQPPVSGNGYSMQQGFVRFQGTYEASHLTFVRQLTPPFSIKGKVRKADSAFVGMVIQVGGSDRRSEEFLHTGYLGAAPTAAGPQTGMGLPNGLRRRKFRSSEIPVFRIFDKIAEKTNFLRGFLRNPSVESVPGEHTQLFTEGFPVLFHEGLFSSWKRLFSC